MKTVPHHPEGTLGVLKLNGLEVAGYTDDQVEDFVTGRHLSFGAASNDCNYSAHELKFSLNWGTTPARFPSETHQVYKN